MLYLEDYLELIEHLPQELRDRFTDIRERDLQVHNSSEQLKEKVKHFFASAKKSKQEQRECEFQKLLDGYRETENYADDKVHIAAQMHNIMTKLVQRLDTELERFKLELEADHAGITEELEKRSLELDSDTRFDDLINNHLNSSAAAHNGTYSAAKFNSLNASSQAKQPSAVKDRRRSEHKQHRHHPYHNNQTNGYHHQQQQHGRGKLSNHEHDLSDNSVRNNYRQGSNKTNGSCRPHMATTSNHRPSHSYSSSSAPSSVAGDLIGPERLNQFKNYHLTHQANDPGSNCTNIKQHKSNPALKQQPSLSAALTMGQLQRQSGQNEIANQNKISGNDMKDTERIEIIGQNPLAAAASQAIAATQQLQQGRRTPSLKASFAAINAGGLNPLEPMPGSKQDALSGINRNALAPMAPDQQGLRFSHFGKPNARSKAGSSPLYGNTNLSVTKSGRATKRPKHHASHLYPDESPTSNHSSDNSVFENSESMSSADFVETGTTFGSSSPASLDFATSNTTQGNTTLYHRDETKYCVCRQISYGEMVACDNVGCEIEWFHYDCVGITQPPKGKWFCPDCTRNRHPGSSAIKSSRHFKETSSV